MRVKQWLAIESRLIIVLLGFSSTSLYSISTWISVWPNEMLSVEYSVCTCSRPNLMLFINCHSLGTKDVRLNIFTSCFIIFVPVLFLYCNSLCVRLKNTFLFLLLTYVKSRKHAMRHLHVSGLTSLLPIYGACTSSDCNARFQRLISKSIGRQGSRFEKQHS